MTPMKAIRAKCLDCCCGQQPEVRKCTIKACPLWPYRMGHRPPKETYGPDATNEKTPEKPGENEAKASDCEEEEDDPD